MMLQDRNGLRLGAGLLLVGVILSFVAGIMHPSHELPNNHAAVFAEYAASSTWTAVHLGQFAGMAVLICGMLTLGRVLQPLRSGLMAEWLLVAALALYAALQAVDGVALKQAVNAWASAPESEKVARFAVAEGIRWLEWAVRSYYSFAFGIGLVLVGLNVVMVPRVSRAGGYALCLAGTAYLVQGWILGIGGFSDSNSIPTLAGIVLLVVATLAITFAALKASAVQRAEAS